MRWDLTNLPLNSPVPHNRDAITGIQWHSNLHYQPLMQCGGAPQIFPLILAGCWGIKLSAIRSCDSCFFPPPPKLKGRSRAVGAQLAFLLAVDASLSSPSNITVSRSVVIFSIQHFLRHGGGYYWEYEHQKVGDSGSYSAFVPGVCLHGRRFNW